MADVLKLTPLSYIVILGASITNLAMGMLDPTIGLYLLDLGEPYGEVGRILSARFLVVAIASIPLALFASRIGISKVLYASGLSAIFSGSILYFGEGSLSVYYFYLVAGISQAAISGPGAAILAENKGTKRVAAFALFSTTWMIPPSIGAAISTVWFSFKEGESAEVYSTIFVVAFWVLVVGGIFYCLLLSIMIQKGNKPMDVTDQRLPVVTQARLLFAPIIVIPFLLLSLTQFLSGAGAGATLPFLPPYLQSLDARSDQISLLVMIMNLSMGIATQLSAPLSNRFGDVNVYMMTTVLSIVSLLGIVFTDSLPIASTFYILRGTFANMSAPIGQSRMIGYVEDSVRATGSAWTSTGRWVGWSLFSPISGDLIDQFGYEFSFVFTSIIYFVSMIIFVFVIRRFPDLEKIKADGKEKLPFSKYLAN